MADQNNPGQFGNRDDTEQQASKGGHASSGSFGSENRVDPSSAGRAGAEAQPSGASPKAAQTAVRAATADRR